MSLTGSGPGTPSTAAAAVPAARCFEQWTVPGSFEEWPKPTLPPPSAARRGPNVRADMAEVSEYPHLAVKYQVGGVPDTVVNETHRLVGAQPEINLVRTMLAALGK